jgi:hypothetical protein
MLSIMPIEGASTLDLHLQYSLRDLAQLKNTFKYDITFWYCEDDVKSGENSSSQCNPLSVIEAIKQENFNIWYSKNPKAEKLDLLSYTIKESKMVILAISDSFAKNEKCVQVFDLVKNIIKKNYLLMEFGKMGERNWIEDSKFVSICSDFRIIMLDPARYPIKLVETLEIIERQLKDTKIDRSIVQKEPDVFISYCWANSIDAVKKGTKSGKNSIGWLDPRNLAKFFQVI